ncbi:hypothetical protein [Streptomyces sp. NPDC093105]|uniref:hypothetical protein n=1 Tax=Streptomyces sp. NPDC093105 TaxID=3366029 RepID=UPI003822800D
MARRPIALVTAAVLLVEAPAIVGVNAIMARFVEVQSMSLDGLDPDHMVTGTWALGIGSGLALALCALVALLAGLRDRGPGRFGRGLLIGCAVVHGLLGAVAAALIGWGAFAVLMTVVGLIVLTLVMYGKEPAGEKPARKSSVEQSGAGKPAAGEAGAATA